MIKEITAQELNTERFIAEQVQQIQQKVGNGQAINALSGGVDSSTVTMPGHRALGDRLTTVFIQNGLNHHQAAVNHRGGVRARAPSNSSTACHFTFRELP